jgi:hypothetical protein
MAMRETGFYKSLGGIRYFIPHELPPKNPKFELNSGLMLLYGEANFALGQFSQLPRPPKGRGL